MRLARKASDGRWVRLLRSFSLPTYFKIAQKTVYSALEHDVLTVAQATAYSAMVALFPALIVSAAVVSLLPETLPFRFQVALFFDRILPSNVSPILQTYFDTSHKMPQTTTALISATVVSVTGAASVVATLMEGFRRAHRLPLEAANFWRRRGRALLLVPISLLPMAVASALVVFGHLLTQWMSFHFAPEVRTPFFILAFLIRWSIALAGSIGIIAVIYHLGTDVSRHMREHMEPFLGLRMDWSWRSSLPGATLATVMWFLSTLLFGLYVTRYANYSKVYGSLGAAIALMFWLYLIAISVLFGAEFNAELSTARRQDGDVAVPESSPKVP